MANNTTRPLTTDNRPMLKMKELIEKTAVSKATILLYVQQGLLPKPVKTSPNMAYYDPLCIERIGFIKKIQVSHRLSLAAIKDLIGEMEKGRDVAPFLELQSMLFGSAMKPVKKKGFCRESGLDEKQVDELVKLRILVPLKNNLFDTQDIAIGSLLKKCLDQGLRPEDLCFYPELSELIVEKELKLSRKHTKGISFEKDAAMILELTHLARGIRGYVIDRITQKKLISLKGIEEQNKN